MRAKATQTDTPMAITKNPTAADALAHYTVTRAFFWAGEVVPVGASLELTKADSASLLAAYKITPAVEVPEADKPKAKAKAAKAEDKAPDA